MSNVLIAVLSLFFLIIVALFVITPMPLKFVIQQLTTGPRYPVSPNAVETNDYTLYTRPNNDNLLIWFNGGAFLFSEKKTTYGLLNQINDLLLNFDILVFNYPTRFTYTVYESLMGCNKIISNFIGSYKNYYSGGYSAGVLLMGTFIRKENDLATAQQLQIPQLGINIKAAVCVNGLYDTRLTNRIVNQLFKTYILRGTDHIQLYSMYNLSLPKLVIGAYSEFLNNQTKRFLQYEYVDVESKIYDNPSLTHLFPLYNDVAESKDAVARIVKFLTKYK